MKKFSLLFVALLNLLSMLGKAQTNPLEFVRNEGQWNGSFDYKSITGTGNLYFSSNAITYLLAEQDALQKIDDYKHGQTTNMPIIKYHAYKMVFEHALQANVEAQKIQQHYYNYFLGNDASKWKSNIHPALALDYKQLYDGVDLHISSENRNLKYDFIVAPHADPNQIQLRFEGVDKLSIQKNGSLAIATSVGEVKELKPVVYQYIDDQRILVPCKYELHHQTISFVFPEDYNHNAALIIDPTVVFCTFSGSTADNWGFTATYDDLGNMYTGGLVSDLLGGAYPVSLGAFQTTFGGGTGTGTAGTGSGSAYSCDMAIMKINSAGSAMIYATYLGGSDNDQPHSMIVDKSYNLVIAGRTYSTNFPTTTTAFDRTANGGADIVITKLNAAGTALIGSTYVGGSGNDCVNYNAAEFVGGNLKHNYGDDARSEVILDNLGNIYVASSTFSTNFPTQNPIQATNAGGQDAVLVKMNSDVSAMLFSTYLGGSVDDAGYVLALNKAQNAILMGGGTMSANFPTTSGTYHPAFFGGTTDGYVVKIANGPVYTLQKGTFIGANNYDQVYGLAIDGSDNIYTMGQTLGGGFPVSSGVFSVANSSQFVMKLDNNLTAPIFSTVYGSGTSTETNISPVAFLVDTCENVYISGWGGTLGGASFPNVGTTKGMPITSATAIQPTTDGYDFYFIVFAKDAASLLYGSYFGSSSTNPMVGEHVDGGTSRFDKSGIIYQAICGGCGGLSALPTTPGSLSPKNASSNCNLASLKIAFDLGTAIAHASAAPKTSGCSPLTVNFINTSINGKAYVWDFADGTPTTTLKEPTHTFYKPGKYRVRLIVQNPDACIKTAEFDTTYVDITVDSNSIAANFVPSIVDSCHSPYKVSFKNTSAYGKSGTANFYWDFGDGTSYTGTTPPVHAYSKLGTYIVRLIMDDPLACNHPDSIRIPVTIVNSYIKAATDLPDVICVGQSGLYFANYSTNATSVFWDFGDGTTSTAKNPTHKYDTGTFLVTMIVYNPTGCVQSDTFKKKITVRPRATANFDYLPKIPIENDSTHFTNLSVNALGYLWLFGDGTQSRAVNPAHLYRKTGTFKTCLVAEGYENCNDTICKNIDALVVPRIDVPTAFTPNGDHLNDILYVRGAAIDYMDFSIYNRWGQLVFHTNTMEAGWDGTFNGIKQPMETYAYVLNATYINGETESKRGNITLLE
jgi:gliding motility-associated-like protein